MSDRIIMEEGRVYRPRKGLKPSVLLKLLDFCDANGQRFGQALANATHYVDIFYIENEDLEKRIKDYINQGKG